MADLVSECMVMCSIAAKVATGPPMRSKRDQPHVLDGGIGEHALDVFLPRQEQCGDTTDNRPKPIIRLPAKCVPNEPSTNTLLRITAHNATFSSKPESTAETGVGLPHGHPAASCATAPADLGAIADQQEYKCQLEHGRFQIALDLVQVRPQQGAAALAEHAFGGKIQQDGAEQGERDAHAAQDEILPGRLQAGGVRYRLTSSTVVSVAASMATQRMPILLVVSATSMVKVNS